MFNFILGIFLGCSLITLGYLVTETVISVHKLNKTKNQIIENQNQIIELQKHLLLIKSD